MELYDPFRFHLVQYLCYKDIISLSKTSRVFYGMLDEELHCYLFKRDYKCLIHKISKKFYRDLKLAFLIGRFVKALPEIEGKNVFFDIQDKDDNLLYSPEFDSNFMQVDFQLRDTQWKSLVQRVHCALKVKKAIEDKFNLSVTIERDLSYQLDRFFVFVNLY